MKKDKITDQIIFWAGKGGMDYTKRNPSSINELESLYKRQYGVTRSVINKEFFGKFSHSLNILEVGSNVGVQLELLRKLGFKNLFGIEINERAILQARKIHPHLNIIKGSGFNIPFRDKSFDLVFTSGVLIHINPKDLDEIMREIYRVSSKYIWGYEYYSDHLEEVGYRGKSNLIWKRNFAELYLKKFKDLSLIREKRLNIINSNNISQFFLLKK